MVAHASRISLPIRSGRNRLVPALALLAVTFTGALADVVPLPPERPADLVREPDEPRPGGEAPMPVPDVPLPRPRPEDTQGPGGTPQTPAPGAAAKEGETCVEELARSGARVEAVPPPPATGGCGIASPVRLTALPDGVDLKPAAIVNCAVARTLVDYVGKDVAAAARERFSARVAGVDVATSYDCRPQNHVSGAKMSEHGVGNAVDIAGFRLDGGRHVTIGDPKADAATTAFVADVRKASCARFTTVLGPGSDSEHGNHLHLDLRQRSNGYRICQ